jgi:hypothetical protein
LATVPPPHAAATSRLVRRAHLVKVEGQYVLLEYGPSAASRFTAGLVIGDDLERTLVIAPRLRPVAQLGFAVPELHVQRRLGLTQFGRPANLGDSPRQIEAGDQTFAQRPVVPGLEGSTRSAWPRSWASMARL